MKKLFNIKFFVILLIASFNLNSSVYSSETVGTAIEITDQVANLFLYEQYSKPGFTKQINGNTGGVNYSITIKAPKVKFLDDIVKIYFGFKIESNVLNSTIEFDDNLNITINPLDDISVSGISDDFENLVNSKVSNSVLRAAILAAWNSLNLELYPMKLAEQISNEGWMSETNINIVWPYFAAGFDVDPGILRITACTFLAAEGNPSFFRGCLKYNYSTGADYFKVSSDFKMTIKDIKIYNSSGQLVLSRTPNVVCNKNEITTIDLSTISLAGSQYYGVKVLITKNNTFYQRKYWLPNSTSENWRNPESEPNRIN